MTYCGLLEYMTATRYIGVGLFDRFHCDGTEVTIGFGFFQHGGYQMFGKRVLVGCLVWIWFRIPIRLMGSHEC